MKELFNDLSYLKDITMPFPVETQEFVLKLHQRLIDFGFKCEMKTRRFSIIGHFFLYSYKSNRIDDIWIIKVTPDECGIRFDDKNASQYENIIENFPSSLLDIIRNGDGCTYNSTPEKCQIGSKGIGFSINGKKYTKCNSKCCAACDFWIPLTNLTDEVGQAIENWVELELKYLSQSKRR